MRDILKTMTSSGFAHVDYLPPPLFFFAPNLTDEGVKASAGSARAAPTAGLGE